ncbi:MAG: AraC family transcriptional regulator [Gemmiger sp.]|nr:AraC family transcriptional regulator [Gemmiger sp.]
MLDVDVMQDASEIVHYDNPEFPLYIRYGVLSAYPHMKALCHWHEDIELVCILAGEMYYDVNGCKVLLHQGDTIMVNAKQMHYGYAHLERECSFLCILFHPQLLMGNAYTSSRYITPITENPHIAYLVYRGASELEQLQKKLMALKEGGGGGFALAATATLFQVWGILYETCKKRNRMDYEKQPPTDLAIQKKMVSYIYQNYREAIPLAAIAAAGHVSASKCCILFKKYLQQSPIDFANAYRLEVSCNLLKSTTENISSIAFACGFNHLSYYSKLFYRKYRCTPGAFRKAAAGERKPAQPE